MRSNEVAMNPELILELTSTGERRRLRSGRMTIGRAPGNDWVLADDSPIPTVSRQHCMITATDQGFTITDLKSTNGTYLGACKLDPHLPVALDGSEFVQIGHYTLTVTVESASSSSPIPSGLLRVTPSILVKRPIAPPAPPVSSVEGEGNAAFEAFRDRAERPMQVRSPDPVYSQNDPLGKYRDPLEERQPVEPDAGDDPKDDPRGPGNSAETLDEPVVHSDTDIEEAPPASTPESPREARTAATGTGDDPLAAFLQGAGLSPGDLHPADRNEFFRSAGETFAHLADALREVLLARDMVKHEANLRVTLMRGDENNPIKLSINAREVTLALLKPRGAGYLAPADAVDAARRNLIAHEMGILAGFSSAVEGLLKSFEPSTLEARLPAIGSVAELLHGGRSARLWELYQQHHADISSRARRQFLGDQAPEFRAAYERRASQLEKIPHPGSGKKYP
jgi:type VI secretion system protein ImpI